MFKFSSEHEQTNTNTGGRDLSPHATAERRTRTTTTTATKPRIGKYGVRERQAAAKFLIACCCLLLVASRRRIGGEEERTDNWKKGLEGESGMGLKCRLYIYFFTVGSIASISCVCGDVWIRFKIDFIAKRLNE